jgi:hypothetical protein
MLAFWLIQIENEIGTLNSGKRGFERLLFTSKKSQFFRGALKLMEIPL